MAKEGQIPRPCYSAVLAGNEVFHAKDSGMPPDFAVMTGTSAVIPGAFPGMPAATPDIWRGESPRISPLDKTGGLAVNYTSIFDFN